MWIQAGFAPDEFWHQTPRHFQMVMQGVRKRMETESEARLGASWHTAAFNSATQSKQGLKPLDYYLRKPPRKMSNQEMLGNMRLIASRVNRNHGDK